MTETRVQNVIQAVERETVAGAETAALRTELKNGQTAAAARISELEAALSEARRAASVEAEAHAQVPFILSWSSFCRPCFVSPVL